MQQTELFPVLNPCIGVCQSNTKGYCMGCLRSRTERLNWKDLMPAEKMRVIEVCDIRKIKLAEALKAKQEKEEMLAKGIEPTAPVATPKQKDALQQGSQNESSTGRPESGQPENSLDLF
jgi:predicted Fe-S protein YdhL (DUF1289 family)